jgi:hypothetical protein
MGTVHIKSSIIVVYDHSSTCKSPAKSPFAPLLFGVGIVIVISFPFESYTDSTIMFWSDPAKKMSSESTRKLLPCLTLCFIPAPFSL